MLTPNITYQTPHWFHSLQLRPSTAFPSLSEPPKQLPMSVHQMIFNEVNSGGYIGLCPKPWLAPPQGPKLFAPRIIVGMKSSSSDTKEQLSSGTRVTIPSVQGFSDLLDITTLSDQSDRPIEELASRIISATTLTEEEEESEKPQPATHWPLSLVGNDELPKDTSPAD